MTNLPRPLETVVSLIEISARNISALLLRAERGVADSARAAGLQACLPCPALLPCSGLKAQWRALIASKC